MAKIKFQKEKRSRVRYGFIGATTYSINWWYNTTLKVRENREKTEINKECNYSTHAPCMSVRAFRKMLSKIPYGVEFKLVSRWVGFDVYGKGSKR